MMTKRLGLMVCALILLISGSIYGAPFILGVSVLSGSPPGYVPPGGGPGPPPPTPPYVSPSAMASVGFTAPAFTQDFTQMSLGNLAMGCFSGGAGGGGAFTWYQGLWYEYNFGPSCPGSYQIVTDGATKALDLRYTSGQTSGGYGQTTVMSIAPDGTHPTTFTHGYFEWVTRMSPFTSGGQWMDDWMWTAENVINGGVCSGTSRCDEVDVVEQHSEKPHLYVAADHQWTDNGGHGPNLIVNKSIDYTQYHKFGLLWTPGENCFYVDDVQTYCGATTEAGELPRFLMMSQGIGCVFTTNDTFCVNVSITNATNNGSGAVHLAVSQGGGSAAFNSGDQVVISGVGGVPGANGTFTITNVVGSPVTSFDLVGSTFSGTYTSGGTVNPVTTTDLFAKSVKVWQGTYIPGVIWNSADNSDQTLGGTVACSETTTSVDHAVRATNPKTDGKRHLEFTLTGTSNATDWAAGLSDSSEALTGLNASVGVSSHSIGIIPDTGHSDLIVEQNSARVNTYSIIPVINDVIAMEVDIPNKLVWWQDVTQGSGWTNASNNTLTGNPSTGVGGTTFTATGGIMPIFGGYFENTFPAPCATINPLVFQGTVSTGFTAWGS